MKIINLLIILSSTLFLLASCSDENLGQPFQSYITMISQDMKDNQYSVHIYVDDKDYDYQNPDLSPNVDTLNKLNSFRNVFDAKFMLGVTNREILGFEDLDSPTFIVINANNEYELFDKLEETIEYLEKQR